MKISKLRRDAGAVGLQGELAEDNAPVLGIQIPAATDVERQQTVAHRVVLHRCVLSETIGLQCRTLLSSPVVLLVKIDVHVMLERLVGAVITVNVLIF